MAVRVVVADDQALSRGSFRVLVDSAPGLETVGEAAGGEQAVEVVRRERADVHPGAAGAVGRTGQLRPAGRASGQLAGTGSAYTVCGAVLSPAFAALVPCPYATVPVVYATVRIGRRDA